MTDIDKKHAFLFLISILLLTLALRLGFLTRQGFWNNEFITVRVVGLPFSQIFSERLHRNLMPMYFYIAKGFKEMLGLNEVSLRLPSALFSFFFVIIIYIATHAVLDKRTALLAALIATIHQYYLKYAFDCRMYGLVTLMTIVSITTCFWYLEKGSAWRFFIYFLASLFGLFTQLLFAAVVAINLFFWFINRKQYRHHGWKATLVIISPIIAFMPIIYLWFKFQYQVGKSEWQMVNFGAFWRTLLRLVWGNYSFFPSYFLRGITIPLALLFFILLFRYKNSLKLQVVVAEGTQEAGLRYRFLQLLLVCFFLPMVGIILASLKTDHAIGRLRYYAMSAAALPALLTLSTQGIKNLRWRKVYTVLILVVMLIYSVAFLANYGDGVREAIHHVNDHKKPGDALIVCNNGAVMQAFEFYHLDNLPIFGISRRVDAPQSVKQFLSQQIPPDQKRVWVFMYHADKHPLLKIVQTDKPRFVPVTATLNFNEVRLACFKMLP